MRNRQLVEVLKRGRYIRRETAPTLQTALVSRVIRLLWLLTAIIMGLITFRFIFKLLAANTANGFVNMVYTVTDVLIEPFKDIIRSPSLQSGEVFDTASLFAVVVYLLLAIVIVTLFRILFASRAQRISIVEHQRR